MHLHFNESRTYYIFAVQKNLGILVEPFIRFNDYATT